MNFEIGSDIEVTTRLKSNVLWIDYEENTFKGKIVENPKWLGADYICVATGNIHWPISMIKKEHIVGHKGVSIKIDTRVFQVTSKQSKKTYSVVVSNGKATCDCLGFQYRQSCKHSKKVLDIVHGRC
jgi:hypothetical protein